MNMTDLTRVIEQVGKDRGIKKEVIVDIQRRKATTSRSSSKTLTACVYISADLHRDRSRDPAATL